MRVEVYFYTVRNDLLRYLRLNNMDDSGVCAPPSPQPPPPHLSACCIVLVQCIYYVLCHSGGTCMCCDVLVVDVLCEVLLVL